MNEHGFLLVRTNEGLVTVQTGGIRDPCGGAEAFGAES
jgi:hypothetical protein